jgi:hypothetical protein
MTSKVVKIVIGDQQILIDRADLKGIDLSSLRITPAGYAAIGKILLHRLILNPPEDMEVDHKNLNRLDNRRQNLRICSHSGNMMNRGKQKTTLPDIKALIWIRDAKVKITGRGLRQIKKLTVWVVLKNLKQPGRRIRKLQKNIMGNSQGLRRGNHET